MIKRAGRKLLYGLLLLVVLAAAGFWAFRNLGRWLVIDDPLQPARAIVVLSGVVPYRAMEAAAIYKQGWAPEIWLFRDDPSGAYEACAALGIHHVTEEEYDEQVLEHLGVPRAAIHIFDRPSTDTLNEFELLRDELRTRGGDKIIVVTSPVHTRRARIIWRTVIGNQAQAIVRYDTSEPTDPAHWWRTTADIQYVVHEVLGLIDCYLGFAVGPGKV